MPSSYQRRRPKYVSHENNSFWLSFSDLMSAMLLVFIMVMFYSVYQNLYKSEESEQKTIALAQQQLILQGKESELDIKNQELDESQQKLTDSEKALILQQLQLKLSQESQEKVEATLGERQKDLDAALSLLNMKEEDLQKAQSLLNSQQAKLSEQQIKLDDLVGVKARIVQSLASELKRANVKAKVDEKTGSITLDANVLFDLGKSDLKEGGKQMLDQFLPVYLNVLLNSENQKNISEIIIEGHTDSMGTYLDNLRLSQARALSVMQYVLSDENTHISAAMKKRLSEIGTCNGRSYSNLLYSSSGAEDAEASRRVEFKFRMQDEQMIQSMRDILGSMGEGD